MYWSRTGSPTDIILIFSLCLCWCAGGWLLVTHVFRIRPAERILAGLAAGFLLFIALSNLLANLLPILPAYWTSAVFILGIGLGAAWRSPIHPKLNWKDWQAWPQLAVLVGLTLLFTLIGNGLAIFDDYLHLPLVSAMAAGDIPPTFISTRRALRLPLRPACIRSRAGAFGRPLPLERLGFQQSLDDRDDHGSGLGLVPPHHRQLTSSRPGKFLLALPAELAGCCSWRQRSC